MNKVLKFLLLSTLRLLAMVILLSLKVNIMEAQEIVTKQLIVARVHNFALSPDGEYIAFCNIEGVKKISLRSKKQEWLLQTLYHPQKCPIHSIKWSPGMTHIAFVNEASPQHNELKVLELMTKKLHIIDRAHSFHGVTWSPDRKQLAWIKREGKTGQYRLVVGMIEKNKVCLKVLYEAKSIHSIHWTIDGQFLIFVRDARWDPTEGNLPAALGVIQPDGVNLRWLLPSERFPMHEYFSIPHSGWAVSPDGTIVAFGLGDFIWLHPIRKSEKPPVKIRPVGRALEICWSPDGKGLLYVVSEAKASVAPGSAKTCPPHSLYWIDKEGRENRFILREEKGIYNLQWVKERDIFYISGGILYKVTLRK
jgi:dipeptidyl aminopeptidase/acylaminoacyl peptidase